MLFWQLITLIFVTACNWRLDEKIPGCLPPRKWCLQQPNDSKVFVSMAGIKALVIHLHRCFGANEGRWKAAQHNNQGNARAASFFHLIIKASTECKDSRTEKGDEMMITSLLSYSAFVLVIWNNSTREELKTSFSINWKGKQFPPRPLGVLSCQ